VNKKVLVKIKHNMFTHSTTKVSNEHVNYIVKSILNKKQRNIIEQQQTFIRRNTDENKKRNNYLVDKFTMKKRTKFEEFSGKIIFENLFYLI